jgi:hypothetical protein
LDSFFCGAPATCGPTVASLTNATKRLTRPTPSTESGATALASSGMLLIVAGGCAAFASARTLPPMTSIRTCSYAA